MASSHCECWCKGRCVLAPLQQGRCVFKDNFLPPAEGWTCPEQDGEAAGAGPPPLKALQSSSGHLATKAVGSWEVAEQGKKEVFTFRLSKLQCYSGLRPLLHAGRESRWSSEQELVTGQRSAVNGHGAAGV